MDVLSEILGALDLQGTLYFSTEFRPPWGVEVPAHPGVARFHLVMRGDCWVSTPADPEPVLLGAGDLVLVPHGSGHILAGSPDAACLSLDDVIERSGFDGRGALVHGGEDRGHPTRLVCGHFAFDEAGGHPLLEQLPSKVLIRHDDVGTAPRLELDEIFRIITREVRDGRPGGEAIVRRLSEVLFVQAVRVWAERQEARQPAQGFVAALLDRHLGASLEALHRRPGHRWTVEELAHAGALSRTVFAERFRDVVGMSPMQYVTFWRLHKARGLLERRRLSLDAVAQQVGYESTAAFSRAFKKQVGDSPGAYRRSRAGRPG